MTDTHNLNVFGKDVRLPGGPNDKNPTARHEGEPVPGAEPEAGKGTPAKSDKAKRPVAVAEQVAPEGVTASE
ncbi:MAG: hypothetical protein JWN35_2791 [Frankiales bacterium]|jgi:hypothetical protein|nr:hypothetical protein [Frankiales bacterium]